LNIFLIFSKGFGQLTRPADGVGTFDPRARASKPSGSTRRKWRKIAISGKTVAIREIEDQGKSMG
jgi:hypothetical protein